ncbi:MAG: amidohydrolase family protein [Gemmatimonadaceae bacterium]
MGLAGPDPLIDVHAHFYYDGCARADWRELNAARLRAGAAIGISCHVGSILGSWGRNSPIYFQSPADTIAANDAMLALQQAHGQRIRSYVAINPNDTSAALAEISRCIALGAVGIKLAAARRADDTLLDPILALAAQRRLPILHHVWQHRRRYWPGQDASDASALCALAARHPTVSIILAHIGGGGDYNHTFAVTRDVPNVYLDLSGSGVDRGMLEDAAAAVGPRRLLWGADLTLCTGLAKLWALQTMGLSADDLADIRWRNALRIFPAGAFPAALEQVPQPHTVRVA